jgi:PAS domain S-box-containing protein
MTSAPWHYIVYANMLLVIGAALVVLAFGLLRKRKMPETKPLGLLMLAGASWCIIFAMEFVAADLQTKIFLAELKYVGIVMLPTSGLLFTVYYVRKQHWLKPWYVVALLVICTLAPLLLVLTNEMHNLFWTYEATEQGGGFTAFNFTPAIGFWLFSIYARIVIVITLVLFIAEFIRSRGIYRKRVGIVVVSIIAPTSTNAVYDVSRHIIAAESFPALDLTPFGLVITCFMLTWAIFRLRLGDIIPVANAAITEGMSDLIIVVDSENRIVKVNAAAESLKQHTSSEIVGQPIQEVFPHLNNALDLSRTESLPEREVTLDEGEARNTYDTRLSPICDDKGSVLGKVIVLHDITERKRMEQELIEHSQRLEEQVEQRTRDLTTTNEKLRLEITERNRAKRALEESVSILNATLESTADGILVVDTKGNIENFNKKFLEMWGIPEDIGVSDANSEIRIQMLSRLKDPEKIMRETQELYDNPEKGNFSVLELKDGRVFERYWHPQKIAEEIEGIVISLRDVTERKQAEEALKESEERFRTVIEAARDIICSIDVNTGILTSANSFGEQVLGYRREDVVNKLNFTDLVHPDDHERLFTRLYELTTESKREPNLPLRLKRADGTYLHAEINGALVYDAEGNPHSYVGVIRDVTERLTAELSLKESEERYRTLVDNSLTGICLMQDGNYKFVNERFCEMAGYSREELLEMSFNQIIHPDDLERTHEALARRLSGDTLSEHQQLRAIRKNGDIAWVETLGTVVEYKGTPAVLVNFIDITDRKKAEERIVRSEERYRMLFEESKDGVFISTPEGIFLDINQAGVEMYGYSSKDELLNVDIARDLYVDPEQREAIKKELAEKGYVKDYELHYKRKDGRIITVLETVTAVRDENNSIVTYRGIQRDVTEQKQIQQQLLQAQKMESIGTLAGGIAHDFNNLLGGVLGYASLIKNEFPEDHRGFGYANTIEKSATRAAELTAQLLGFARGGKYEVRPLNLNIIADETLGIIERTLDKSIQIETNLSPQLPTVEGDAGQLQQVLLNLCLNAADAMHGGGKLTIETGIEALTEEYAKARMDLRSGSCVCLSVTDTGIGIDQETQKRIFEPFFTTKEEGKGTGLGLAMVYGVIKNHGGYVSVYSEPDLGTTFKIYFPISGQREEPLSPQQEAPRGQNELILVVDDEEHIRSFAQEVLEANGYRVLLAADGAEALALQKQHDGDIGLVMLDLVMPRMGGHEAFLRMKARNPELKALLSTGYGQKGKAQEILDDGVLGFLQKPYQPNALLSKIRSVLDAKV